MTRPETPIIDRWIEAKAIALRTILGLLATLIEITLITTAAITVVVLVAWALVRRHRPHPAIPARHAGARDL